MIENSKTSQFPRIFYARHMQPGVARYENDGGHEHLLVDTDAMKNLLKTGVGKPVYIQHQNVDLKTMKEKAAGYITDSFYNELDGWGWFKFLAIDDDCHQAVANNWSVSNAYLAMDCTGGGTKNNVPYDRELKNGEFTHLAIVPNPRYEGAKIFSPDEFKVYQAAQKRKLEELQNSTTQPEGKTMFNLFKMKKETVSSIDAETHIELSDGTSKSIGEIINSVENSMKKKNDDDQMVECAGQKMPLKELINKYEKLSSKTNAEDEESDDEDNKKSEKKNKKEKKNADADADDGRSKKEKDADEEGHEDEIDNKKKEKKNSDDANHFEEIKNAPLKIEAPRLPIETSMSKLQRGKAAYGSVHKS